MFYKLCEINGRRAIVVGGLSEYDIKDTFECGQAFRYELVNSSERYIEYLTVVGDNIISVGQYNRGELIFYDVTEEFFCDVIVPYFSLDTDYKKIRDEIRSKTDSEWLKAAIDSAKGIAILKQDPEEALISFIISQNNNIPRIRGIIKKISAEYGVNICLQKGVKKCPLSKIDVEPCEEKCKSCGICYTFPKAKDILENPEKLLPSKPGFRYKYILDAAKKLDTGEVSLEEIKKSASAKDTARELMKILGVGEKVAYCVALFGFSNLDAFPIDVWMKRAIDTYFNGHLDYEGLGEYRGVAQQYIFHYIRNLENK